MKLWYKGKEILIKKVFHLSTKGKYLENQGSIKKTREAITPIVDTVKLCNSKSSIERSQGQRKN